mgnify:CR=1 FL=1
MMQFMLATKATQFTLTVKTKNIIIVIILHSAIKPLTPQRLLAKLIRSFPFKFHSAANSVPDSPLHLPNHNNRQPEISPSASCAPHRFRPQKTRNDVLPSAKEESPKTRGPLQTHTTTPHVARPRHL